MKTVEAEVIDAPKGTEVARQSQQQVAQTGPSNFAQILAKAEKLDPEKLKLLMDLQDRWDATEARKAFDKAMAAAKAEIPVIAKNRKVGFAAKGGGARTDYRHEDLAEIARTIDPIIGKYGLSYRYRTVTAPNQPVSVTCIVSHDLGHFEENSLSAGADNTGNKNSIQAIGSTITYLQRYLLKAAFGLAASNDDDGKKADETVPDGPINEKQIEEIQLAIVRTGLKIEKFCRAMDIAAVPDLPTSRFEEAMGRFRESAKIQGIEL